MMDYQNFTKSVRLPCCVLSVQKTAEGTCGEIRIVAANQLYKASMPNYRDGMIYSELVPQDNRFEDFCFRSAILGQRLRAYVEVPAMDRWADQTLIPLASDREDVGYCQFVVELTEQTEAERMAAVSINTAESAVHAFLKLMGTEDFKTSVGNVLDVILKESDAKAARILLVDHEKRRTAIYCERAESELYLQRTGNALNYHLVGSWEESIDATNALILKDERDMQALEKQNPVWAQSLRENKVESLALTPLHRGKQVVGYLYVINFDVRRVLKVKELIELMSFFLGTEIYNHLLLGKLEMISMVDELTGLNNRRAMARRMKELSSSRTPYGLVNIDLNGLKTVNDRDGHAAGDRLLVRTGTLLETVFDAEDIFRTGGDEFIVIAADMDRETFERKKRMLRAEAEKSHISFALGGFWSDGAVDLKAAYRCADEMMYADKNAFYAMHSELKRR